METDEILKKGATQKLGKQTYLNLKDLKQFIRYEHLKMAGLQFLKSVLKAVTRGAL